MPAQAAQGRLSEHVPARVVPCPSRAGAEPAQKLLDCLKHRIQRLPVQLGAGSGAVHQRQAPHRVEQVRRCGHQP